MTVTETRAKSAEAFAEARRVIPGGVNSPVRAFRSVGGDPVFIERGSGSHLTDVDGNDYLDYVLSWGPLVLGHAHPAVVSAIGRAAAHGTSFGAPTRGETELAELVIELVPGVEMVRLVSSGTEATMSALRLARAATSRNKIIKFAGCYHGHSDMLLVKAGSGVATLGLPDSPGVTAGTTADMLVLPFNDLAAVEQAFAEQGSDIAAIIIEPVPGNMGVIEPDPGYLAGLRQITSDYGALLIFDEVLSGFRVALGGAVARYGVVPDLITLGKVIGGGLPLAAYAGRREIMELIAPSGPVYQAGTLSGNPLAVAAGLATLNGLREPGVFDAIEAKTGRLIAGFTQAAESAGVPVVSTHAGTMGGIFFSQTPVRNFDQAMACDTAAYARWFRAMLDRGIYLAPSAFETIFVSAAHTDDEITRTIEAAIEAFGLV